MPQFLDAIDRPWEVNLTAGLLRRIREKTGLSVLVMVEESGSVKWDAVTLPQRVDQYLDVLWLLVEKQADSRGVTRADFEDAFVAETYPLSVAAFYDAILSFSHLPTVLREMFGTGEEVIRRMSRPSELTLNEGAGS